MPNLLFDTFPEYQDFSPVKNAQLNKMKINVIKINMMIFIVGEKLYMFPILITVKGKSVSIAVIVIENRIIRFESR